MIASGVLVGGLIGLIAGTAGGWVDDVLMRITDVFLALPGPILAIAVVAALGPSLAPHPDRGGHRVVAVLLPHRPGRGEGAGRPAPRGGGPPGRRRPDRVLAVRHLLPGAIPATVVTASLDVGNLVLTLAALSFLGLGRRRPPPSSARWPPGA